MVSPAPARKPEGGFRFISVVQLCMAWWAYKTRLIRLIDLRVWFAAHEVVARRCQLNPGQQPVYTCEELHPLVGGGRGIPASLQRLTRAALLSWSALHISFPTALPPGRDLSALHAMLAQIPNHDRLVPVPRRLLRFLAGGCRRNIIATLLGLLFRCLYYRQGQCHPEGFCKASWIAEVFGVSLRPIKAARHELERLDFVQRIDVPHWVMNRYGLKLAINLQWAPPSPPVLVPSAPPAVTPPAPVCAQRDAHECLSPAAVPTQSAPQGLTPPPEFSTLSSAPPNSYKKLSMREEHQKPAGGGPAGVLRALFAQAREAVREGTALLDDSESVVLRTVAAPRQQNPLSAPENAPASVPAPILRNIVPHDLHDPSRLFALYEQAVQAGLIGVSEAERLTFVALACHVLRYRPQNAGGLFHCLLTRKLSHVVTQEDEDAARHYITRYLYGEGAAPRRRITQRVTITRSGLRLRESAGKILAWHRAKISAWRGQQW